MLLRSLPVPLPISSTEVHNPGVTVLYMKLKDTYDPPLGKLGLEALMKCPIVKYVRVGGRAYKVKIQTCHLKTTMDNCRAGHYLVDTWKSRVTTPTPSLTGAQLRDPLLASKPLSLKITS